MSSEKSAKANWKKGLFLLVSLAFLILLFKLFSFSTEQTTQDQVFHNRFLQEYSIYALNTPPSLDFCGEEAPLNDQDIRERLDRELLSNTYFQSNTLLLIKRANKWFPIIEPILKSNGVPSDFKYLALVESNLTNVVSPAGATGFWQLMKPTAKSFNLEVNDEVDERYNVVLSTEAACQYLLQAHAQFNSWTLAAAGYNRGIDGIKRQLKKQQSNNFYDLYLNTETSRYVFRLLAIKEIVSKPENYGFHFRKKDLYPVIPTHTISVDSSIANLAQFALSQNVNYKILKIFNPWLRKNVLTNKSKKTYIITLPDSGYALFGSWRVDSISAPPDSLQMNDGLEIDDNK